MDLNEEFAETPRDSPRNAEGLNPYQPTVVPNAAIPNTGTPNTAIPDDRLPSRFPIALLFFLPGTTIGLHLGSILEQGVTATVQRTLRDPLDALLFFGLFGAAIFLLSFLYRLPRRFVAGPHEVRWWSALASGALVVSFAFTVVILSERTPLSRLTGPFAINRIGLGLCFFVGVILGVEFEAYLARVMQRRVAGQ